MQKAIIPLPGVEGRFDHAAFDPPAHRLFFAALGNDTLEVLDIATAKRLHTIAGMKKPTGVLFLADFNLLVVANGGDGTCRFYDGTSYQERARIADLDDADNLRFDAPSKRVYLGYGDGALGVIDPAAMKLTTTIPLAKHPESFQLEANGPRVFVNVPDAGHIAVVDRTTSAVTATWPLGNFHANFPMALDEPHHRLFVGCRRPARLLAIDTRSGKPMTDAEMSGDVDDLFYDAGTTRIYASCGEGFIDVFSVSANGSLTRSHRVASNGGARTAYFSSKSGQLYVAVPHRGIHGAEIRIYDATR